MRTLTLLAILLLAPVAALANDLPGESLYQLDTPLVLQDGRQTTLDSFRGRPLLVSMFYSSCPHVCPALVSTLQSMHHSLNDQHPLPRILVVSIDPDRDTPQRLQQVATERRLDPQLWSLAQTPAHDVRELAAALGIQYRQLPDGEFNHSTIISLLDAEGRVVAQTSLLGRMDEDFVAQLRQVLGNKSGSPSALAAHYGAIRQTHIGAVIISVSLFLLRGVLMIVLGPGRQGRFLKVLPHVVDTVLLASAVLLSIIVHQYPLTHDWLTAKVIALVAYIVLGSIALKYGRTRAIRISAFVAALAVVAYIVSVALTHQVSGILGDLRRGSNGSDSYQAKVELTMAADGTK